MSRVKVRAAKVASELLPMQSTALLQELHLLTRGGDLNADARRKLKQINHYCNLLRPELDALFARHEAPVVVDAGAGNAYLGFVLYEVFLAGLGRGELWSVDLRQDVVARGRARAEKLGYERMKFIHATVQEIIRADELADGRDETAEGAQRAGDERTGGEGGERSEESGSASAQVPRVELGPVKAVISLHACNTATDEAILLGLRAEAELISLVPCCQAELHTLLKGTAGRARLGSLWRHAMHRREFAAHLTNVIRVLVLEAHGYKVRVTELVGWEHSAKNELIVAVKHQRGNAAARRQLENLLADLPPLDMMLLRQMQPPLAR